MSDSMKIQQSPRRRWLLLLVAVIAGSTICIVTYGKPFLNLSYSWPTRFHTRKPDVINQTDSMTTQPLDSPLPVTVESEPSYSKIKKKLLQSSWIKLFPHLRHMVTVIDEGNVEVITNAKKTEFSFEKEAVYEVGGVFKAKITSYGENGKKKTYGGDFYIATLRRPNSSIDGISCDVADNMDGSYDVLCILPWEGRARIDVVMLHPSESIFEMMKRYSSEEEYGYNFKTTLLNSKNKKEFTNCSVGFPSKSSQELCDYSNPSHGEQWTCVKPPSRECSKIIWQEVQRIPPRLKFFDNAFFRNNVNYNISINGLGGEIQVKETNVSKYLENSYKYKTLNENPVSPTGWFLDSKWTSVTIDIGRHDINICVKNKRLYFFGDSTVRQWYQFFLNSLKLKDYGPDNSVARSQGRDAQSKIFNLTLQYRAHGSPLHNPGPEESRPYISNSLDLIREGGNGTIVFVTIGFHFNLLDPDVLGSRIRIIKNSMISLLKRVPGAKIFIKGLHNHGSVSPCPSPWLNFRYDVMLRHEFNDISNIEFIGFWDMTVVSKNSSRHPKGQIFNEMMRLVLGYIC